MITIIKAPLPSTARSTPLEKDRTYTRNTVNNALLTFWVEEVDSWCIQCTGTINAALLAAGPMSDKMA